MFSTSWLKARFILLVEALLLGAGVYLCRLRVVILQLAALLVYSFPGLCGNPLYPAGRGGGWGRASEILRKQRHDFLNHLQVIYGLCNYIRRNGPWIYRGDAQGRG